MNKNVGSRTLAIFVALSMLFSMMTVLTVVRSTPGIDEWEGDGISNDFVNTSTSELYYGNTLDIQFNVTILNAYSSIFGSSTYYLYYPVYKREIGYTGYEYNITWEKWGQLGNTPANKGKAENVHLNVTGMWFVCDQFSIQKTNLTNMSVYNVVNGWRPIVGWFWVNSTKYYDVKVSPSTIHYDKNETVTITVTHNGEEVGGAWCDIRKSDTGELIRHEKMDSGTWTFNPYDYTHDYGAGVYNIIVYRDMDEDVITYGVEGGNTGYNDSFGDTSVWDMQIRNSTGATGTINETTYYWDTCGPFDPPEYTADMVNLTVVAGEPQLSIPEANATMYWSFDGEVNVSIKDYDGNNITLPYDVIVFNRDKEDVTANVTINKYDGYCLISSDSWGRDSNGYVYGTNGTWYIRIVKTDVGNASEEWNGTVKFKVTKAPGVQIKLIDDGDGNNDGEISEVPDVSIQPLTLKFQVISRTHDYLGSGDFTKDTKNITLSGNALFLENGKTLYDYNQMLPGSVQFTGGTTWEVNITPTMALNGGDLTISVDWGKFGTATQTISIGGTKLNGSIVSISPSEFVIGENVTLKVTVTGPTGYPYPNADVYLYYINDSGGLEHMINHSAGGGTTTGEYTFFFNVTQQTDNQSDVFGNIKAPRYIAAYADVPNVGYGYAYATMKPKSDLEVEVSKDTLMAGQATDFWINVSILGSNGSKTPADTGLHVRIYNSTGDDVTDSIGSITSAQLDNDATIELTGEYITEPGTYTIYAYNDTHNSEGHNATITVVPVEVTCDKSEFIYMYDDNISATFTVTWQGQPVGNGTLRIYNMTDVGYNKTWTNTSDPSNSTLEVGVTNGVVTIHNITANYLPEGKGRMNITFTYKPEESGSEFAEATGVIPVKVPDATPTPDKVALNEPANVNILVTGRGEPLEGVFVSIEGPGNLAMNGTTGADGTINFAFVPSATGDINIKVYNRSTGSKIAVTSHTLNIDAPAQVNEGATFTVTVKDENGNAVGDAKVTFSGTGETKTTDTNGQVTFDTTGTVTGTLPYVTYKLTATKAGYRSDEESIMVVSVPQLYIDAPTKVDGGSTFTVKVTSDTGEVYGVEVTFNGETKTITGPSGVTFTAPSVTKDTPYTITATKEGYKDGSADITVKPAGIPGFELITLIAAIGIAFILLRRRH